MGWTATHKPHHVKTKDWLREEFTGAHAYSTGSVQCLADAFVFAYNNSEYYAVVKRTTAAGDVTHFLLCVSVKFYRGEFNIGYKDMTDHMGPCMWRCPEALVDMIDRLDPIPADPQPETSYAWARDWRAAVRKAHADRKARIAARRASA
jgi:hypothetical protein